MTNNELCHFGIKGQKWGVRRYQNEDGTRTLLGKKRRSKRDRLRDISDADLRKSTDPKVIYANRDRLSDQELQARINRINMENNLSRMSKGRSRSSEFKNKVLDKTIESASQEIAKEIGKGAAKAAMAALGGYAAAKLGSNATVQFAKWWLNTYKSL